MQAAAPRKAKHHKARRRKPDTPLEQTRAAVHVANGTAPTAPTTGEPIPDPPVLLSDDLLYWRERGYCLAASSRFRRWMLLHMASVGITIDHWPYLSPDAMLDAAGRGARLSDGNRTLLALTLAEIFVEASLLLRVRFPAYRVELDDEPDTDWLPRDEGEAAAVGLSIRRPRKTDRRPKPELPGCQGDGGACRCLRRFGARFCPVHERAELKRMRGAASMSAVLRQL